MESELTRIGGQQLDRYAPAVPSPWDNDMLN
jgi:hypothetical protein